MYEVPLKFYIPTYVVESPKTKKIWKKTKAVSVCPIPEVTCEILFKNYYHKSKKEYDKI